MVGVLSQKSRKISVKKSEMESLCSHDISPSEHDRNCDAGILHTNIPDNSPRKRKLLEKIILYSLWINWPVTKYVKTHQCNKMSKWHWRINKSPQHHMSDQLFNACL